MEKYLLSKNDLVLLKKLHLEDVHLYLIDDNPFNSRSEYDEEEIRKLAASLHQNGLLCPVKVRENQGRYQLAYGHRRVRAARLLNWSSIKGEIGSLSDEQMLQISLVENLERKNLSDYEKALCFQRLNRDFGETCEEIGRLVGYSKQHICNFLAMTHMLDEATLAKSPSLSSALKGISEHHARILLRIKDAETRAAILRLVVSEDLSVRDLQRMLQRFRSWFEIRGASFDGKKQLLVTNHHEGQENHQLSGDLSEIHHILESEFRLAHTGDFRAFRNLHTYDIGFSIFDIFPPLQRFENAQALDKEKNWFYRIAPKLSANIRDIRVQFFSEVALATLYVDYKGTLEGKTITISSRGTVLFLRKRNSWKIIHEHWSRLDEERLPTALPTTNRGLGLPSDNDSYARAYSLYDSSQPFSE